MLKWKKVKLSELGEIFGGATPSTKREDYYNGNIPWLTPKDLSGYNLRYISKGERSITKEGLDSCSAKIIPKNSVLFTSRAPIGYVAIAENEMCTNQGFKNIVPNEDTDPLFLYYLLKYNKEKIESMGSGTTFKEVSATVMKSIEVKIPNYEEQKRIANILSSLDDKIELNNRINKNLEAQAQAIFKSWFVDFEPFLEGEFEDSELGRIPKGWRVGKLGEIAMITMGQSPKGDTYNENGKGTVFYQGRAEFGTRFPKRRLFTTAPNRMANENDILLSVRAPVGDYNIATESCCIGRGLASIKPLNQKNYSYCIYLMAELQPKFNQFNAEGTVFGSINKDSLNGIGVIIPDDSTLLKFENLVSVLNNQIRVNHNKTQILVALRDTLLPKLMNGELLPASLRNLEDSPCL